ncbi:hypothetical protein [Homoserinimonas sp. OAct 916]|uniref:hypothetical protein n=1 Tax=Homoserinimonas sp. OAct 916 TaxID=2211450 RepID=UPI001300836A|nr:hypothetical protein [Homoserinimonas sp. OAct 916]
MTRPYTSPQPDSGQSSSPRSGARRTAAFLVASLIVALLLIVQFVFGMFVNLFVNIPADHPGAHPAGYFSGVVRSVGWALGDGTLWLTLHAALGLLLVLGAAWVVVLSLRAAVPFGRTLSVIGLLAILGAGFNGGSFLNYNNDISSMIMAGLFAVALASYVIGLFMGRRIA